MVADSIRNQDNSQGEPLVSVVCMTFNQEDYIKDALDSILAQKTSFPFEVIVHDDASTDSTTEIVKEYEKRYPNIVRSIIQDENQYSKNGGAFHRFVLPACRGKYIASCEGDDYWCDSFKLEQQINYLENHPDCPACAHDTWLLDCRNNRKRRMSSMTKSGMVPIRFLISSGASYHTSSLVRRKAIYADQPNYAKGVKGVGDYPLRVYLALNGGVYYLNSIMSVYRYRAKGSWSTRNHTNKKLAVDTHEALIRMLEMADDASMHRYHTIFCEAKNEQELMILDAKRRYREMLSEKYRSVFLSYSTRKKLRIIISALVPFAAKVLDK